MIHFRKAFVLNLVLFAFAYLAVGFVANDINWLRGVFTWDPFDRGLFLLMVASIFALTVPSWVDLC